MLILYTHALVS